MLMLIDEPIFQLLLMQSIRGKAMIVMARIIKNQRENVMKGDAHLSRENEFNKIFYIYVLLTSYWEEALKLLKLFEDDVKTFFPP
jgi:hypothetical protein